MKKYFMWGVSLLLMGAMVSCKTSQSAYKAAYEKAQEKKIETPAEAEPQQVVEEAVPTTTPSAVADTTVRTRSERINAVDGNDDLLKSFNVIVGSFKQRTNAQSLCERLRADGYPAVLAQNAQGMYRVVACSFDNRAAAVEGRQNLQARYPQFTDAWFLINE